MSPTIPEQDPSSLLRRAVERLRGIEAGNPRLEAEYLAAAALGIERIELLRRRADEPFPPAAVELFERLLARRLARAPLQYVLGTAPFCDLLLEVGPGTLIPRSETEVLVERVVEVVRGTEASAPLLVDVGTGSGAILLACLHALPAWKGVGLDRSPEALRWTQRNRDALGFTSRAALFRGDLCAALRPGSADLVVSNPPYIRRAELPDLAPEIRDHEPRSALDGGEDGLEVVRRLVPEAEAALCRGGWLALELAPDQPAAVAEALQSGGHFDPVRIFSDLAARPRGVLARKR